MADPTPADPTPQPPAEQAPPKPSRNLGEWRPVVGRIITLLVVLAAVVLILWVWNTVEKYPRTDDATVQANVIGVAPRAHGQIIQG